MQCPSLVWFGLLCSALLRTTLAQPCNRRIRPSFRLLGSSFRCLALPFVRPLVIMAANGRPSAFRYCQPLPRVLCPPPRRLSWRAGSAEMRCTGTVDKERQQATKSRICSWPPRPTQRAPISAPFD
ncbi:hypothetical protein BKA81DRAFT_371029 [Phyllosticta paracitricarpa]